MVGVPRSRGCHNCRRARVKCDEQQPACYRCTSRGKECEGYDRYATFVNRTGAGVQKRTRPEESMRRPDRVHAKLESLTVPEPLLVHSTVGFPSQPRDLRECTGCTIVWLKEVAALHDASPLLIHSLRALAANRVAAARSDDELAREARNHCGEALRLLSSSLDSYESLCDDHTLAAIRCLMIYELFESTTASVVAWGSHQKGLARICTLRGPRSFCTTLAKALLLDIKSVNMISSTQYSLPSVFGNPRWWHIGDCTTLWDIEHKTYDIAFRMCAVFQQEKKSTHKPDTDRAHLEELCDRLNHFVWELDQLLQSLTYLAPSTLENTGVPHWNLESAIIAANIMTLNMNASMRTYSLITRLGAYGLPDVAEQDFFDFLTEKFTLERSNILTKNILTAVRYAIKDEMGLYSGQRCLYAVRMMICKAPRQFPVFDQIRSSYQKLIDGKGLRHAKDLDKVWGGIHLP